MAEGVVGIGHDDEERGETCKEDVLEDADEEVAVGKVGKGRGYDKSNEG